MDKSAVILLDGASKDADGTVIEMDHTPLLNHVVDSLKGLVDEVILVVDSQEQADAYGKVISPQVKFTVNKSQSKGTLAKVSAGFSVAQGEYTLVLPAGSPFVSKELVDLLFDLCVGKSAVVPRWTNQEMEPLHAVYNTQKALETTKAALAEGELDIEAMVEKMRGVRYLSTMVIEQLDPDFKFFFTVNRPVDLKKVQAMNKPKPRKKKK